MKRPGKKNYIKSNEGFEKYVKDLEYYTDKLEMIKPTASDVWDEAGVAHFEDFEEWYESYGS
tara:strand:+ start:154 stop:339 length:186 start_codon:yes stop_codon:yes gene_type:complete